MRTFWQKARGTFLAGVLVVVPLVVTIYVFVTLVGILESAILLVPPPWRPENLIGVRIPGLGVLLALTVVMALGLLTRTFAGRALVRAYEAVLARVPILSSVYQGVKELLEMLLSRDQAAFEKVVLAEWPRKGLYSIGFMTGDAFLQIEGEVKLVNVFLPTTPNPTTGYFFMLPEDRLIHTDLSVEQGFKLLMSAGIVAPDEIIRLAKADVLPDTPLSQGMLDVPVTGRVSITHTPPPVRKEPQKS
jgi:uncharacterized membrane protein